MAGDKSGSIHLFDSSLNKQGSFPLNRGRVKSLDVQERILVGTADGDILEADKSTGEVVGGEPLMWGHGPGEIWGLACPPGLGGDWFVTTADDKTARVWSLSGRRQLSKIKLSDMSRCADVTDEGLLAVGLGGEGGRGKAKKKKRKAKAMEGGYALLQVDVGGGWGVTQLTSEMQSAEWVSDVKLHKGMMGVGSHDNKVRVGFECRARRAGGGRRLTPPSPLFSPPLKVYLYDVSGDGTSRLRGKCVKHNSYITHLDFSSDGKFIQSNCGGYELLFYSTKDGKQITSASSLRDTSWATQTCTLGWPVQEIFPPGCDGTDVNAACCSKDGKYVYTSDDFGKLNVFNYPCVTKGAQCVEGRGHSSHVTCVRELGQGRVVTTGGKDGTVICWRVKDGDVS